MLGLGRKRSEEGGCGWRRLDHLAWVIGEIVVMMVVGLVEGVIEGNEDGDTRFIEWSFGSVGS